VLTCTRAAHEAALPICRPRWPLLALLSSLALLPALPATAGDWDGSRGLVYLSRGSYPAAMGWYRSEADSYPDESGPLAGLALSKCRVGRFAEAGEHAAAAAQLDPDDPMLLTAQACLALVSGDPGSAHELHQRAADSALFPFHQRELAWFLIHQGRFPEAAAAVDEMVFAGWEGRTTRAMLAECDMGLGRLELAQLRIDDFQRIGSGPRRAFHVETLATLADDLLIGPSAESFPRQLSPFDASQDMVVFRAEALRRLGQLDAAETESERRKREPLHSLAWAFGARIATDAGDLERAGRILDEARPRWPLHPSLLLSEARLEVRLGRRAAAASLLEQARAVGVPAWDTVVENELADELAALAADPGR
jgi:tetratricopeptide (TPR) repeat protein